MNEKDTLDILFVSGTGAGAVGAMLLFLRKLWMSFAEARLEVSKDGAEVSIVEMLRGEVQRLSDRINHMESRHSADILALKEEHKTERRELVARISELETQLKLMKAKHKDIRQEALDIYVYVSGKGDSSLDSVALAELKDRLMAIVISHDKVGEDHEKLENQH
jgi:seryl-tRNA synthetase